MDLARYAELFRTESREHLAEIDAALLALEQDERGDGINVLFRSTHTIKGMAASMGYRNVELISHSLESLLHGVRSGARALDSGVMTLLFDASDALARAVDDAVDTRADGKAGDVSAILQRLASAIPSGDQETTSRYDAIFGEVTASQSVMAETLMRAVSQAGSPTILRAPTVSAAIQNDPIIQAGADESATAIASHTKVVDVRIAPDAALKGVRAVMVLTRLESLGTVRSIEPAQHSWNHDAFDGVLSITVETNASDERIAKSVNSAGDILRVAVRAPASTRRDRETLRHVRIDLRRLDTLLDLVGELVITRDRLLRAAEKQSDSGDAARERTLASVVHDTSRLVSALQDEVLRTRMVPVGQVFDRFPRLVRDLARELGKEVTLVTEGRDIELDRSLLDAIGDPIVHLLRNAIDHGLEMPEARRVARKPAAGRLVLRAARDRAAVIVQVQDDGGGIDRDAVLARARGEGLVENDTAVLNDDGLLRVLAKPGFSTAKKVSAVSGRGVGIDVVASRVRALGGTLEVQSTVGRGSTFTLRLPVTLAIVRALVVRIGDASYALPTQHVLEVVEWDPGTLQTLRDRETVTLRDEVIPLLRMRERFGEQNGSDNEAGAHLVVVEASGRVLALHVDALIGQQDVVVKPYDVVHGAETLFTGATILGDGTPALIVDLGSLT